MALILSRKRNEVIYIGSTIKVTVVEIRSGRVRLAIDAPKDVIVHREEVHKAVQKQLQDAAAPVNVPPGSGSGARGPLALDSGWIERMGEGDE